MIFGMDFGLVVAAVACFIAGCVVGAIIVGGVILHSFGKAMRW